MWPVQHMQISSRITCVLQLSPNDVGFWVKVFCCNMTMLSPILPVQLLQQSTSTLLTRPCPKWFLRLWITHRGDGRLVFQVRRRGAAGGARVAALSAKRIFSYRYRCTSKALEHLYGTQWRLRRKMMSLCTLVFNKLWDKKYLRFSFDSPSYMFLQVICSRPTALSKVTIQHNHWNRENIIQNKKYQCNNNIKSIYSAHCTCKFESLNDLSLVKNMNKFSLIRSTNNLSLANTIIELSAINNIPLFVVAHPTLLGCINTDNTLRIIHHCKINVELHHAVILQNLAKTHSVLYRTQTIISLYHEHIKFILL